MKAVDIRRRLPIVALNARETARLLFSRVPRIDELRPQIVSELPRHPIDKHDRIAQFALVFLYAYQQWQLVAADPAAFDALLAECTDLRKRMLLWAPTAVLWKVFTQAELDAILGGSGHSDIADDTSVLGRMSLERWASLEGKVGYTHADAERAVVAGQELFKAWAGRMRRTRARRCVLPRINGNGRSSRCPMPGPRWCRRCGMSGGTTATPTRSRRRSSARARRAGRRARLRRRFPQRLRLTARSSNLVPSPPYIVVPFTAFAPA